MQASAHVAVKTNRQQNNSHRTRILIPQNVMTPKNPKPNCNKSHRITEINFQNALDYVLGIIDLI